MKPPMNTVSLRAAVVRQICLLLDTNTPLHQSQYLAWLQREVLAVYRETGPAIITDLELASLGDGIALMQAFEQILGINTQIQPGMSVGAPAV
jgi:hypothetical protein